MKQHFESSQSRERDETLSINAPTIDIYSGETITIRGNSIDTVDNSASATKELYDFLIHHLRAHPMRGFKISAHQMDSGTVSVSMWWESNDVQEYYTKYAPTLRLSSSLTEEEIRIVFSAIEESISPSHPHYDAYMQSIDSQKNTVLILMGYKKVMKTIVANAVLVADNPHAIRKDEQETSSIKQLPTLPYVGVKRGEVPPEDTKKIERIESTLKVDPSTRFADILSHLESEMENPNLHHSFVQTDIREKRFLSFIVSLASFIKKQGSPKDTLWSFYAKKYVEMIRAFLGTHVFKDKELSKVLKKLWHRIQITATKLSRSTVLQRFKKQPSKMSQEERFSQAAAAVQERMGKKIVPPKAPRAFQERAQQVRESMQKRKEEATQKPATEKTPVVQPSTPQKESVEPEVSFQKKGMWEKMKDTVTGWFRKTS